MEIKSECLKGALAMVEASLASEKEKREAKVSKAKKELAQVEKKAEEKAMEVYKALADFTVVKG